ncbi:MAG TPA: hypothetical protein VMY59_01050 [Candidatus Thermoplasmatota archaeon]|nr:hypothetical protein [Candidatus Thermoplasmatota archaeon]
MRNTQIWLMEGIAGVALAGVLGFMMGGNEMVIMAGVMGAIVALLPFFQMMVTAKAKNITPFFFNLKEENGLKKEKFLLFPGRFGKLGVTVAQILSEKVLYVKGAGLIDDKGTEYGFGNAPLSFWEPGVGYTTNTKSARFHNILRKDKDIKDYDEMIRAYLKEEDYKTFTGLFRKNPEPSAAEIDMEIQWLKDRKNPESTLSVTMNGETYSIQDDLPFMKYNYHPQTMKNFVENEKINVRREEMGYKNPEKAIGLAKAIAIVVIAVVILLAVLSSLDLSKFGNLLGG